MGINIHNVRFVKSAVKPADFIRTPLPGIAFAGKSNVGKSSVINCLLNRKNFARVGNTPGMTVNINYFLVDDRLYFIDLPGYGYAKVSKSEKERWGRLMEDFFAAPDAITLGVLIVDSRHKPTEDDRTMAGWFKSTGCPMVVVANKCDKLKKSEYEESAARIRETLELPPETEIIFFSAVKGTGRDALMGRILDYVK